MVLRLSHLLLIITLGLSIYLLSALSSILLPFVLGFALAYFLDPVADRLEALGLRRSFATAAITMAVGLLVLLALTLGLPLMATQISLLVVALPSYIADIQNWMMAENLTDGQSQIVSSLGDSLRAGLQDTASSLLFTGLSLLNVLSLLIITPIVAVYMLNDWDRMTARIDTLLPDEHSETIRELARQIDAILGGFARGQIMVCMALGVIYAVGLSVVGLQGGIFVGLLAGLVSFVPYVGAAFGLLLAGALGLGQFGFEWASLGQIGLVFLVGQFIEGNVLTPRWVGDRVQLHPVWIIFALLAMGSLFGFLGLLLAVPIAAILGVLIRYAVTLYQRDYVLPSSGSSRDD
ncbi:MAG: AI-2E family transporter [Alphaproteobacteria bacterium]|nr:AI-2E family transporter [Alphaproteobacteria bacterium]